MVPLDGSRFAEAALDLAFDFLGPANWCSLPRSSPRTMSCATTMGRTLAYLDQQAEDRTREGRCYLEEVARRVRQTHPALHVSLDVRMDKPSTGIIEAAAERAIDLVVMSTHGRTGLRRDTVGSVAGDVLRMGTAPLLLIRPVMPPHQAVNPEVYALATSG